MNPTLFALVVSSFRTRVALQPRFFPSHRTKTKQAKSWLDAAFGELLRQIKYKSLWNSQHFVQVDRFFPSTQLCSACGYQNRSLSLSHRQWSCPACATHHMRDFNSAKNVKIEGLRIVAEGYPETRNACRLRVSLAEASIAG